jgi:hypothetical protein
MTLPVWNELDFLRDNRGGRLLLLFYHAFTDSREIRHEDEQLHLGDLMCMDTACGCDQPFYDDPIYDRRYQHDYSNGYLVTLEQFPWFLLTAYAQVAHLLCPRMEAEDGFFGPVRQ